MKIKALLSIILFVSTASSFAGMPIKVCTDESFWYPFVFVKDKNPTGIHVDIVKTALRNLNYDAELVALPWKRCLNDAKQGLFDGVATASYKDERAEFMYYPDDAKGASNSKWRVTQVEYVVITSKANADGKENDYSFTGDIKSIPQPVRVTSGYSVIDRIRKEGLKIDESPDAITNYRKLARDHNGSIIDLYDVYNYFSKQADFAQKMVAHKTPIESKSYYFTITKAGRINLESAHKIWDEIAKLRDDEKFMNEIISSYNKQ